MVKKRIKLSIQEIIEDFEKLVRYDERLDVYLDNTMATDDDIDELYRNLEEMIIKYIPNYKEHMPSEYFLEDTSTFDKALMLYKPLYENFKEIIYQLV